MRPCGPLRGRGEPPARGLGLVLPTCVHPTSGVVLISATPVSARPRCGARFCRQG
jgi:hypothetical protein